MVSQCAWTQVAIAWLQQESQPAIALVHLAEPCLYHQQKLIICEKAIAGETSTQAVWRQLKDLSRYKSLPFAAVIALSSHKDLVLVFCSFS